MAEMSDPAHRRTLIVGVAVALFLVASVAIAASRGPASTAELARSESAGANADGTAGETGAMPADGSAGVKPASPAKLKPGTKKPAAATPPVKSAPTGAPAPEGSRLSTISAAPQQTLGMIVMPEGVERASYDITFRPYGWSPAGPDSGRLVARIMSATGTDKGAAALDKDLADRNATFTCSPTVADRIDVGGNYSGRMEIRQRGDVGVLYLVEVQVAE